MANVVTTGEAREALHKIAQRFDAGEGEPVYFGSHRRAQAVIVPVAVWEKLLEAAEDELDTELALDRLTRDEGRHLSQAEVTAVFDRLRAGRSA
jgi:PHD/YefM family antitoxin component YafN of YafNO toxin-antitoxin module